VADQVALDPLAPEAVAAHLAPIIDRLRLAVARRTMQLSAEAGLIESAGLDKAAFQLLLMLRNAYPHRAVTLGQPTRALEQPTALSSRLSTLTCSRKSPTGRWGSRGPAETSWTGCTWSAPRQSPSCGERKEARRCRPCPWSIGLWWPRPRPAAPASLMTPTYDAPGASTEVKLSERLAGLRFHRFDAHVASWTDAGFTAEAIKALGPGPERTAIEQETNRRAGTAYPALDPSERLALLAALGSLPGS
jgi:hypothetical protein